MFLRLLDSVFLPWLIIKFPQLTTAKVPRIHCGMGVNIKNNDLSKLMKLDERSVNGILCTKLMGFMIEIYDIFHSRKAISARRLNPKRISSGVISTCSFVWWNQSSYNWSLILSVTTGAVYWFQNYIQRVIGFLAINRLDSRTWKY